MISRCHLGLPVRMRSKEEGGGPTDYTDSAFLAGMLSLFGSAERTSLYVRVKGGSLHLVRHPTGDTTDLSVTLPENTSRDQLVAWSSRPKKALKFVIGLYATKWFINRDFLAPHVRAYLYKQAGMSIPLWLTPLAALWMVFDLIISHAIVPRFQSPKRQHEINQALCIYNAFGIAKILLALHPNPDENMREYYCTWRNQREIFYMYLEWRKSL